MKEISERFPKFWADFISQKFDASDEYYWLLVDTPEKAKFNALFGYLVLKYFPKHGIEIERLIMEDLGMCYGIHCKNLTWQEELKIPLFKSPEEAITKAAEIRERQLEGK